MDNEEQRDHDEESYNRRQAASEEVSARRPGDTSAAIAANRRRGLIRKAEELRAAGWHVVSPEDSPGRDRYEFGGSMCRNLEHTHTSRVGASCDGVNG